MSKIKELLVVTDEGIEQVRKHYQKTESDLQQDVAILKEWLRQQPHLPDDEDEGRLERMFVKNKCRLEQTKKKLDKLYSFKVLYPEMLEMYHIDSAIMQNAARSSVYVPLPKLTDKFERVFLYKMINTETFRGFDIFVYMLMMMEICNTFDYSMAAIVVVDWNGFSYNAMKTVEPGILYKYAIIFMEALSGRLAAMQYINAPTYINYFLQIAKSGFTPKIYKKITCPSTIEGVPKQILPIEYGGEEKSIYILHEEWLKEVHYHSDMLLKISKRISNEALRIEKNYDSDLFGVDGSFRKVNLD